MSAAIDYCCTNIIVSRQYTATQQVINAEDIATTGCYLTILFTELSEQRRVSSWILSQNKVSSGIEGLRGKVSLLQPSTTRLLSSGTKKRSTNPGMKNADQQLNSTRRRSINTSK